jgi:hypothetical protein
LYQLISALLLSAPLRRLKLMADIDKFGVQTGRRMKEDGNLVNVADMVEALYNAFVVDKNAGIEVSGSKVEDVTFHDAATVAADGTAFTVAGYKTLTVEITRSAGTSTVAFIGEGPSGADIALIGVNLSTFATGTSTTGTGELWQFDITGLTKVFMDLQAVSGGNVTVKGKAVA